MTIALGILLFLTACAGLGIFMAFQSPTFVAGLIAAFVQMILPKIMEELAKRKPSEEEAKDREKIRQGLDPQIKAHGHGGENH